MQDLGPGALRRTSLIGCELGLAAEDRMSGQRDKSRKARPEAGPAAEPLAERVPAKLYRAELLRLQAELVKLQEWVRTEGARLVVVFEGRDAAGKGSTIKRVSEY